MAGGRQPSADSSTIATRSSSGRVKLGSGRTARAAARWSGDKVIRSIHHSTHQPRPVAWHAPSSALASRTIVFAIRGYHDHPAMSRYTRAPRSVLLGRLLTRENDEHHFERAPALLQSAIHSPH